MRLDDLSVDFASPPCLVGPSVDGRTRAGVKTVIVLDRHETLGWLFIRPDPVLYGRSSTPGRLEIKVRGDTLPFAKRVLAVLVQRVGTLYGSGRQVIRRRVAGRSRTIYRGFELMEAPSFEMVIIDLPCLQHPVALLGISYDRLISRLVCPDDPQMTTDYKALSAWWSFWHGNIRPTDLSFRAQEV